ncbi:DNA primase [Methanobacterium aggregans]|uniref:DNA primase n=1 Tax=Methanobacterium aggregans TaxID=1615586 RepID=UPI00320CF9AF
MVSAAFINPLSEDGKQIVREMGSLDEIYDQNADLIEVITRSQSQEISDIPVNHVDLAIKRIEWYVTRNNKDHDYKVYNFLFNKGITRFDVISFYILCQAIGIRYGPNSRESRVMVESQGKIIENRLGKLSKAERGEVVNTILNSLLTQATIKWTFFEDLLSSKKLKLQDLILDKGQIILDREEFLERFSDRINHRDPEKMYELLIGEKIKELITIKMVMQKTEDYMNAVYEKAQREIEPNPLLLEVAEKVSRVLSESVQTYGYGGGGGVGVKASPLAPKAFPPCVKKVLEGMRSGGRNDAIILFLTPFISYARLYPGVFAENVTKRVSDVDPNLNAVQNEILPMIFGAAERCSPPLFEDQPQEKVNINAKMGFGMHDTIEIKNEGETLWYTPMSCEKVKIHLPSLCKPDKTCKTIGNPLSYYNRMKREIKKGGAGEEGDNGKGADGKGDGAGEAPPKG